MESSLVSIIIPVYNAEKYLDRCLDSICKQTYKNIEIIIVNDGSKDNSLEKCRNWAKKDGRIEIIDKVNEGVSSARNAGIRAAKGRYISFVDADDYIADNMIGVMADEMERKDVDLVSCGWHAVRNDGSGEYPKLKENAVYNREDSLYKVIKRIHTYSGFVWNKLFKREIISKNNISFCKDYHVTEDLLFCVEYIVKIKSAAFISEALYYYDQQTGGITHVSVVDKERQDEKLLLKRYSGIYAYEKILNTVIANSCGRRNINLCQAVFLIGLYGNLELAYQYPETYPKSIVNDIENKWNENKKYVYKAILNSNIFTYEKMGLIRMAMKSRKGSQRNG